MDARDFSSRRAGRRHAHTDHGHGHDHGAGLGEFDVAADGSRQMRGGFRPPFPPGFGPVSAAGLRRPRFPGPRLRRPGLHGSEASGGAAARMSATRGGHGHGPFGGRGRRRGNVRAAILALLTERPMHGYEMIQELDQRTGGVWRPSPGSVYPTLQLLEDEGLITPDDRRVAARPTR